MPKQQRRRIRILYPFSGDTVGGSHLSTAALISHLDLEKFDPCVLLHQNSQKQKAVFEDRDFDCEVFDNCFVPVSFRDLVSHPFSFLCSIWKAFRYLKKHKIDCVHADDGPVRYVWFYAALFCCVPYVHVQRTPLILHVEKRCAYRRMNAVISNSEMTRNSLPSLPSAVVRDICYPVIDLAVEGRDKSVDRAHCLSFFSPSQDAVTLVGFVANLHSRKRPEIFIEMASRLRDQYPGRFKFLMVGAFYDGMKDTLEALVQGYDLQADLSFTGFQLDPYPFMHGLDVLVAPAVREAFGRVLVESMALKTPVVAADEGGHREIISHGINGLLVAPDHVLGFVDAVLKLSDPELSEKICQHGLETVERFKPDLIAHQFENIYETVLRS